MIVATGNLWINRPNRELQTGFKTGGHKHKYHHTTFFPKGLWKVVCSNGLEVVIRGGLGAHLFIAADLIHDLELLEGPGWYMCVFPQRNEQGEIVEEFTGWEDAYATQA